MFYSNPLPQLRARNAALPGACVLTDGRILVSYQIGGAFESVDGTIYASISEDGGKTWNDDVVCTEFPGDTVTCYEQRMCQLDDGTIVLSPGTKIQRQARE